MTQVKSVVGGVRSCTLFVLRNRSSRAKELSVFQFSPGRFNEWKERCLLFVVTASK